LEKTKENYLLVITEIIEYSKQLHERKVVLIQEIDIDVVVCPCFDTLRIVFDHLESVNERLPIIFEKQIGVLLGVYNDASGLWLFLMVIILGIIVNLGRCHIKVGPCYFVFEFI
jgi:hypothetical protein